MSARARWTVTQIVPTLREVSSLRLASAPLLVTCIACSAASQFSPVDRATIPTAAHHTNDDAVILDHTKTVVFAAKGDDINALVTEQRRTVVLTKEGQNSADLSHFYSAEFEEVVDASMRVTAPDGEETFYGRDKMLDAPALGGSTLYHDGRVLRMNVPPVPPGGVVDWRVVTRHKRPSYFQWRSWFGRRFPMKKVAFRVFVPEGWTTEHGTHRFWEPFEWAPEVTTTADGKWLKWSKTDIVPVKQEPSAPSIWDVVPMVSVRLAQWTVGGQTRQEFTSIEDYGRFVYDLQKGTAEPTAEIKKQVQEILTGVSTDPKVRAAKLYEWVQEHIRYVAIEIGMGGWRPYSAAEVFTNRHGDCKDKATLLKTMLRVDGVDSSMVVLYSHRGVPRNFVLPGIGNTNHAILAVHLPDETIIADPTERTVPFGELPIRDQDAQALVIREGGGELLRTPTTTAKENVKRLDISLTIDDAGRAKGQVRLETTGLFASSLRRNMIATSDKKAAERVKGWAWLESGEVQNSKFDVVNRSGRFGVMATGDVDIEAVARKAADARVIRLSEVMRSPGLELPPVERHAPIVLGRRIQRKTTATFQLPEKWVVKKTPPDAELKSPFGSYRQTWRSEGQKLVVDVLYEQHEPIVDAAQYELLRSFFGDIRAAAARPVLVHVQ